MLGEDVPIVRILSWTVLWVIPPTGKLLLLLNGNSFKERELQRLNDMASETKASK